MSHLWLIKRTDDVDYEQSRAHVVVARTAVDARQVAADDGETWQERVWLDPANSAVTRLGTADDPAPRVVLTDFLSG